MRTLTEITLTFVLNAAWQVGLIGAFAVVCAWLLRTTRAQYRHGVWVAALLLSILVPVLSCMPELRRPVKLETRSEIPIAPTFAATVELPEIEALSVKTEPRTPKQQASSKWFTPIRLNRSLGISLVGLYVLFLLYQFAKLFRAWLRTKAIVRSANGFEVNGPLAAIIERCRKTVKIRNVRFLSSMSVAVPITAGVLKPVVILPEQLLHETDELLLTSAIGHELVHVARRDYLLNLIYELLYLPLSFHPVARIIRRRIKRTRELCCDERVTITLLNSQAYAQALMRLIGAAPLTERLVADTTIGVNESDNLEVRIMSLLKTQKPIPQRKSFVLVAVAVLLIIPCVAAAKLALTFDLEKQNPPAQSREVQERLQREVQLQRQEQTQAREQLKRAARQLREQLKTAPDTQRAELQRQLLEVERVLNEHEQVLRQYEQRLAQIRELQNQAAEEAQLREARERLAQVMANYPQLNQQQVEELRRYQRELELLEQAQGEKQKEDRLRSKERGEREKQGWNEKEEREEQEWKEKEQREGKEESQGPVFKTRRSKDATEREQEERARRQFELTRDATVPMDRAIQIATSQVPGKVLACSLGRDGDKLFYHVVIVTTEGDKSTTTYVWVSATDGQILKTEKERRTAISGGMLNGRAVRLPQPAYPAMARAANVSGEVAVQISIDEEGNVVAARAISGHPLLQPAAVSAAREAKFTPTRLQGQPVKVNGTLVYNFVAQ